MIDRYTREEIGAVWSDLGRFKRWLEVEVAICRAWNRLGKIPDEDLRNIEKRTRVDDNTLEEIRKYEAVYKHEVLAFVSAVAKQAGESGRYIHLGVTSSDIIDTALAIQMRDALDLIIKGVDRVLSLTRDLALRHKDTIMMGRTHGVHAEPTTFGLKVAGWYQEMLRCRERLSLAKERVSYGKISGAVGTYSNVDPRVEEIALGELSLKPEPVSTQVVPRDRHAEFVWALAMTACALERIATEIRHLQRTEVLEVQEPFTEGQRGSSAMPHKKNPIHSERICGLARVVRSNLLTALENIALWHERDISHSSAERVILPDASIAVDYMLNLLAEILSGLVVNEERMRKNMELSLGLYCSSRLLTTLAERGMDRDRAYEVVQSLAMKSWEEGVPFEELVLSSKEVKSLLTEGEIRSIFDPESFLSHREEIFRRVFG